MATHPEVPLDAATLRDYIAVHASFGDAPSSFRSAVPCEPSADAIIEREWRWRYHVADIALKVRTEQINTRSSEPTALDGQANRSCGREACQQPHSHHHQEQTCRHQHPSNARSTS